MRAGHDHEPGLTHWLATETTKDGEALAAPLQDLAVAANNAQKPKTVVRECAKCYALSETVATKNDDEGI